MTLPHFAAGKIVKGFQRGTELGFPTANYEVSVVKNLPADFQTGVYCGWAAVETGPIHKMVMSVGWNPFFDNKEKSMETHILHKFTEPNFYGRVLKVCITNFLRPETNFTTVENLIDQINSDIEAAHKILDTAEQMKLKAHEFFAANNTSKITTSPTNGH